ncbi:MAG: BON domain-containing protein [Luteimonas sp.]
MQAQQSGSFGSGTMGHRGRGPKNYTRSDERIREDLNEKLTDSDEIDASGISVEVSNGVATLSGTVDQRWMKHRAEDLAESCSGVRDVNNQIRVRSQSEGQGATGASTSGGGSSAESGSLASSSGSDGGSSLGGSSSSTGQSASSGSGSGTSGSSGSSSSARRGGSSTQQS